MTESEQQPKSKIGPPGQDATNGSSEVSGYAAHRMKLDASLPKELTALFQPLFCKLCQVQLTSNMTAKMHYASKNHEKKVRRFLTEHAERTGEPLHKRARTEGAPKKEAEEKDPKHFYCEACDLPLTGKSNAEQHYMGRNHQNVISGKKLPAGKGFLDPQGRWIRMMAKAAKPEVAARGDDFGMDFVANCQTARYAEPTPSGAGLRCETCDVSVTSEVHLEMHLQGAKHKKKLKALGVAGGGGAPEDTVLAASLAGSAGGDLSAFRTPSGYYYCGRCNLTLNSESQFKQHLASRRHSKKSEAEKTPH